MNHVFTEPSTYKFRDMNGHHGKVFEVDSSLIEPLIIECDKEMTVFLQEKQVERVYYVISGEGYFIVDDEREEVMTGNLVYIPTNSVFTFGGNLKMLLIDAPHWSAEQEETHAR